MVESRSSVPDGTHAVCPDGRRLLRHLSGDADAFGELMRAHADAIYGYLTRCGVAAADRDDVFQDVFGRVHRAAGRFDAARPFRPWLFTIVANRVRSYFGRARPEAVSMAVVPDVPDAREPSPHARVEARETAEWLERLVADLPLAQREVVVLCCIERLPQSEVATALDLPVNTVKTHLRRARLTLAHAMARRDMRIDREASR